MTFACLFSTDLPELDRVVKTHINAGRWVLFRRPDEEGQTPFHPDMAYGIQGEEQLYQLNARGRVVQIGPSSEVVSMAVRLLFKDLPRPPSISERGRRRWLAGFPCCTPHPRGACA